MPRSIKATVTDVRTDYFGHVIVSFEIRQDDGTLLNVFEVRMPHRAYSEAQLLQRVKDTVRELNEHREDEEDPARNLAKIKTTLVGREITLP